MVPRLNYVLMVVLILGLLGGVTVLAITFSDSPADLVHEISDAEIQALVNRLGSRDPEIRGSARGRLLELGERALPKLEEAVESGNPRIAPQAATLVEKIRGTVRHGIEP